MLKFINLRWRIFLILSAFLAVSLCGQGYLFWQYANLDQRYYSALDAHSALLSASGDLEAAVLELRASLAAGFATQKPISPADFAQNRNLIEYWIGHLRDLSLSFSLSGKYVNKIEAEFVRAMSLLEQATTDDPSLPAKFKASHLSSLEEHLENMVSLCRDFDALRKSEFDDLREKGQQRSGVLALLALALAPLQLALAALLALTLVRRVLNPLRRLALGGNANALAAPDDEVRALSQRVRELIDHVGQAETRLSRSQEHLLQAEKLAMVGKMAAGVAHSIRNPLTSVKMRLFSLERSLTLSQPQTEDFQVISEEITHLDNIVQNFLEYSRPPKLKMQRLSPSQAVDMALQLMRHRLESHRVEVKLERDEPLTEILHDPEQIKEVLVNLVVNACEAMGERGRISIREEDAFIDLYGRVAVIQISDNGPGIPEELHANVFQPFFSTKEEGTGLGLSIAMRIMQEHGGDLSLTSTPGKGAKFTLVLPFDPKVQGGARWR